MYSQTPYMCALFSALKGSYLARPVKGCQYYNDNSYNRLLSTMKTPWVVYKTMFGLVYFFDAMKVS